MIGNKNYTTTGVDSIVFSRASFPNNPWVVENWLVTTPQKPLINSNTPHFSLEEAGAICHEIIRSQKFLFKHYLVNTQWMKTFSVEIIQNLKIKRGN